MPASKPKYIRKGNDVFEVLGECETSALIVNRTLQLRKRQQALEQELSAVLREIQHLHQAVVDHDGAGTN
jgi:hypothetical protein